MPGPEVALDVLVEAGNWAEIKLEEIAVKAAEATLAHLGIAGPAEIALLATSDAAIAGLNAEFRGKPAPTNVLSWPAKELSPAQPGAAPPLPEPDAFGVYALGDIALGFETCAREAELSGKPLDQHCVHLIVHAILHLLGYDHMSEKDARLMEGLEAEILLTLGQPNPYQEP
ncbi:MAG: rRNA maturation RNase YbeY [Pseudomonadota bacterium]